LVERKNLKPKTILQILWAGYAALILYWLLRLWGNFPAFMDTLEYVFPEKWVNVEAFRNGRIPLWNPYAACGTPHVANLQSAAFYPLFWVWNFTGLFDWFFVSALLHGVLATLGFYLWLRSLGAGKTASSLCAFSFGGSALAVNYWGFPTHLASIAWVPWLFWAAAEWLKKPGLGRWAVLLIIWALQFLAGYPFFTFYATLFLLAWVWAVSRVPELRRSSLRRYEDRKPLAFLTRGFQALAANEVWRVSWGRPAAVLLALLTGALLTACQWLPFADFLGYLHREGWNEHLFSLRWKNYLTLLQPQILGIPGTITYHGDYPNFIFNNLYFGLVPLGLFLWTILFFRRHGNVFWKVSALFWLLWLAGIHFWPWRLLPSRLVDVLEPAKASFLFLFCACTAVALGIREKMENSSARNPVRQWAWVLGALWLLDVLLIPGRIIRVVPDPYRNGEVVQNAKLAKGMTEKGRLVSLRSQNQYYSAQVNTLADSFKESARVLIPNINAVFGVKSARGYLSIFVDGYQNLSRYLQLGFPYEGRVLDAAAVKLIVFPHRLPGFKYNVSMPRGPALFMRNAGAMPDVWVVERVKELPSRSKVFEALLNPLAFLEAEVFTENTFDGKAVRLAPVKRSLKTGIPFWDKWMGWGRGLFRKDPEIKTSRPSPAEAHFQVFSPRAGWLVFDESFAPGWHAWVDGKPTTIFRANGMWMAVSLGAVGNRRVMFRYEPVAFRLGLFLSLVSLVGFGMFFVIRKMINR
jgi:hypothetical protein